MLDRMDRKILDILQKDCTLPVAEIGKQIGLSTTPCWRRIMRRMPPPWFGLVRTPTMPTASPAPFRTSAPLALTGPVNGGSL